MDKNAINKIIPLRAKPSLKLEAKNDANVNATNERLARSIDFSPYNLRWNSLSSILIKSIALDYCLSRLLLELKVVLLDDVRIYNYARTAEQIIQDYNQGLAVRMGD